MTLTLELPDELPRLSAQIIGGILQNPDTFGTFRFALTLIK